MHQHKIRRVVFLLSLTLLGNTFSHSPHPLSFFHCPLLPAETPGWQLNSRHCGVTVAPGSAIFIKTANKTQNIFHFYAFCCYKNQSLSRIPPPYFNQSSQGWQRVQYKSRLTNQLISKYVCGEHYSRTKITHCRYQVVPRKVVEKPIVSPSPGPSYAATLSLGKKVYETNCESCHQADGSGLPPAFPGLVGAAMVVGKVQPTIDVVVNGSPGTAMQAFGCSTFDETLTVQSLAAVITYVRNSWGNNDSLRFGHSAGGIVTPQQVMAANPCAL